MPPSPATRREDHDANPEQTGLQTEAFLLEQQGKLAEAARKYWQAGDPAAAAILYEQAAESET